VKLGTHCGKNRDLGSVPGVGKRCPAKNSVRPVTILCASLTPERDQNFGVIEKHKRDMTGERFPVHWLVVFKPAIMSEVTNLISNTCTKTTVKVIQMKLHLNGIK
jgi:hypothetical protein